MIEQTTEEFITAALETKGYTDNTIIDATFVGVSADNWMVFDITYNDGPGDHDHHGKVYVSKRSDGEWVADF